VPPSPRALALLVVTVTALSGCGVFGKSSSSHTITPAPSTSATATPTATATTSPTPTPVPVTWSACGELGQSITGARANGFDFSCTKLAVPVDYANPDAATTSLFVAKLHWRQQRSGQRIGSLVFNPGGPGVSGVTLGLSYASLIPEEVLDHFDFVIYDPRGIGLSDPFRCASDRQKDQWLTLDPDVRTAQGRAIAKSTNAALASSCTKKYGAALAQYSTVTAARDLDVLRSAVGDSKLTYLGYSYGTVLGAQYAHLFTKRVRSLVLDGPVDPTLNFIGWTSSQVKGFENEYARFSAWCATQPLCAPLGNAHSYTAALITRLDRTPLKVGVGGAARNATGAIVEGAALYAMYDKSLWNQLMTALLAVHDRNDATALYAMSDAYAERDSSGHYSNVLEAYTAYTCNDSPAAPADTVVAATATTWMRTYPVFGRAFAASLYACSAWPVRTPLPQPSAPGASPILVIGTTHDPATPYAGAASLAKALGSAVVLSWDGDKHTAYPATPCLVSTVDAYLIAKTVPHDVSCPAS